VVKWFITTISLTFLKKPSDSTPDARSGQRLDDLQHALKREQYPNADDARHDTVVDSHYLFIQNIGSNSMKRRNWQQ
jgi:hypothetical protein